jgi:hypothetical protein
MGAQDGKKLGGPTKVVGPSSFSLNWESVGGGKVEAAKDAIRE